MFDRGVDLVTPFCMMQTYEGFVDEHIGIHLNQAKVANEILYPDAKVRADLKIDSKAHTKLDLSSETPLYAEIRDRHFDFAGKFLNAKLTEIKELE